MRTHGKLRSSSLVVFSSRGRRTHGIQEKAAAGESDERKWRKQHVNWIYYRSTHKLLLRLIVSYFFCERLWGWDRRKGTSLSKFSVFSAFLSVAHRHMHNGSHSHGQKMGSRCCKTRLMFFQTRTSWDDGKVLLEKRWETTGTLGLRASQGKREGTWRKNFLRV